MRPLSAIILGYGIRGRVYAAYMAAHPEEYRLAGIADPEAEFPAERDYPVWKDYRDALAAGVGAEAVIIALPDRHHAAAAMMAFEKGYHVLLEKPIGCSWEECLAIGEARRRANRLLLSGYVLRYSRFYRALSEVLVSGVIGELTSVHHLVAISYGKAAHAFCRGNWAVEADGTSTLVQKCTHDFDLITWWLRGRKVTRMASFGSLVHWRKENRPAKAADRCHACPEEVRSKCPFDAYKLYLERGDLRYHFAEQSDAAIKRMIETSRYGRCVYACGNDSVDHQTVLMECAGGVTVTLEMESFSAERRRVTHFYGTRGEIVADGKTIEILPFLGERQTVVPEQADGHHGGGDAGLMAEFARLAASASPERYGAIFNASLESHRLAFMAEDKRKGAAELP